MKIIAAILLLCVAKVLMAPPSNSGTNAKTSFNVKQCYSDLKVLIEQPIQDKVTDEERVCAFACFLQYVNLVNADATINRNEVLKINSNSTKLEEIITKCQNLAGANSSSKHSLCVLSGCLQQERFVGVLYNIKRTSRDS